MNGRLPLIKGVEPIELLTQRSAVAGWKKTASGLHPVSVTASCSGIVASHLYSGLLTKVTWFVRRFGWAEVFRKPLRLALAPLIIPCLKPRSFQWRGHSLDAFYHRYNITWAGERMVEIPIAKMFLERFAGKTIVEVGNVMQHYGPIAHQVIDKYEVGPGVENMDVLDFRPGKKIDLLLSISTFEHIGFDDDDGKSSGQKILDAVRHCRSIISENGTLVITVPLGYNPDLDRLIQTGALGSSSISFLRRVGFSNWEETDLATACQHPYGWRFPYANSLAVIEFSALASE